MTRQANRILLVLATGLGVAMPMGCGNGGGSGDGGDDGGNDNSPVITLVEWAPSGDCTVGMTSDFVVTVTVTDADTDLEDLTFSGSVAGCPGSTLEAATSMISCPNVGTYPGTVTVVDPESNEDSASFSFGPCETGSEEF